MLIIRGTVIRGTVRGIVRGMPAWCSATQRYSKNILGSTYIVVVIFYHPLYDWCERTTTVDTSVGSEL